jgi:hypothetical protein
MTDGPSDKSRGIALVLAFFLGVFGAHRFYAGKIATGLLMLVTLGGLGIWYLYDLVLIAAGQFTDEEGRRIRLWDPDATMTEFDRIPAVLVEEIDTLRRELADLQERVDFTERLLSQPNANTNPPATGPFGR